MAEFQHFIPIFNKISLLCGPPSKRGKEGEKEAQRQWWLQGKLYYINTIEITPHLGYSRL
jgi:hypothetical protein